MLLLLIKEISGCNGVSYEGICLNVANDGAIVLKNDYKEENIFIPDSYEIKIIFEISNAIESIENEAFMETPIKSVSIGRKMKNIGSKAFYGCYNLKSVEFRQSSESLTIETSAFENCVQLQSISISLIHNCKIGTRVFAGCTAMETFDFYNVILYNNIAASTFESCTNLKTVKLYALNTIDNYAFKYCENLDSIDLSQVTKIGSFAFERCLRLYASQSGSLTFNAITSIGVGAFSLCASLKRINYPFTTPPADSDPTITVFPTTYKDGQLTYDVKAFVPSAYTDNFFYNLPIKKPTRTPDLSPLPATPFETPLITPFNTPFTTPSITEIIPNEESKDETKNDINDEKDETKDESKIDIKDEIPETKKENSELFTDLKEDENLENLESQNESKTKSTLSTLIIIISVICAILIIALTIVIIIFVRKYKNEESSESEDESSTCIGTNGNTLMVNDSSNNEQSYHSQNYNSDVTYDNDPFTVASDVSEHWVCDEENSLEI